MSDGGIQTRRKRGYTLIYNDMLIEGMSARAWGVFCYLLSKPDGWETRMSDLQRVFKEGRDALAKARDELEVLGYLRRETYIEDGLQRIRFVMDADQDKPATAQTRRSAPESGFQEPGTPTPETPSPEKPSQVSTEVLPTTERPTTESAAPAARPLDDQVAEEVYKRTNGALNYLATRGIVRNRLKHGASARDVFNAIMALHLSARAVTVQTVTQVLDGILVVGSDGKVRNPTTSRPDRQEQRDQQVDTDRQIAQRMREERERSQQQEPVLHAIEGGRR